jgi:hypothetical protein
VPARLLTLLLTALLSLLGCGCGYESSLELVRTVATDGTVIERSAAHLPWQQQVSVQRATFEEAVRVSGAHDLACSRDRVSIQTPPSGSRGPTERMADGCGQRVMYRFACETDSATIQRCEVVLTGRFSLSPPRRPPASPPAPPPATGCAKDVDCKGDRICVKGECTNPR